MDRESAYHLIQQVREGNAEAAETLVRHYEPEIRTEVRQRLRDVRLRRLLDTMDISQSVLASFFVRVAIGQYELQSPQDVLKLLVRMTRNKVADQLRKQGATRRDYTRTVSLEATADEDALHDSNGSPSEKVALRELIQEFRNRMRESELVVAELRAAGYSWAEIAQQLGETENALRKRLDRAVNRVSGELGLNR